MFTFQNKLHYCFHMSIKYVQSTVTIFYREVIPLLSVQSTFTAIFLLIKYDFRLKLKANKVFIIFLELHVRHYKYLYFLTIGSTQIKIIGVVEIRGGKSIFDNKDEIEKYGLTVRVESPFW